MLPLYLKVLNQSQMLCLYLHWEMSVQHKWEIFRLQKQKKNIWEIAGTLGAAKSTFFLHFGEQKKLLSFLRCNWISLYVHVQLNTSVQLQEKETLS